MVDEQDIDGWVETDGGTEFDIGGVVERDNEVTGQDYPLVVNNAVHGQRPLQGVQ